VELGCSTWAGNRCRVKTKTDATFSIQVASEAASADSLRGCLFSAFRHFFISFWEIQKLDSLKSEKLESPFS
jgi:hypothetical protein